MGSPVLPAAQRAAPKTANATAMVGAGLVPALSSPKLVDNSSYRWHELPAKGFPPNKWAAPSDL